MKKLMYFLVIVISLQSLTAQNRMSLNYVTAVSIGVDPAPLFDDSAKGGLDLNAKVIFGKEHREYGLNAEYFDNLDYLSIGGFYDFIVLGQGTSSDYYIQGLLGAEVGFINRFNGANLKLPVGAFALTGGINATLRWNIGEYFGIEGIMNCKYRRDLKAIWNEENFNKLFPISGRINLIFTLK